MKILAGLACLVFAFVVLNWMVDMAPLDWYIALISGMLMFLSVVYSIIFISSDINEE